MIVNEQLRVKLEPKFLNKNYMDEITNIVLNFFEQNLHKMYYVNSIEKISINNHFINNSNTECIFIVDLVLDVFKPQLGDILSMSVVDIDKKNKFVVFQYDKFKVFVQTDKTFTKGTTCEILVENMKNYKSQIIGIGIIADSIRVSGV